MTLKPVRRISRPSRRPQQWSGSMVSATQSPSLWLRRAMGTCCVGVGAGPDARPGLPGRQPPMPSTTTSQHHSNSGLANLANLFDDLGLVGQLHETRLAALPPGGQVLMQRPLRRGVNRSSPCPSGRSLPGTLPWHNCGRGSASCSGPTWGLRSASWTSRFLGYGWVKPRCRKIIVILKI